MNQDIIIFGLFLLLAFYLGTKQNKNKTSTINPVKVIKDKINETKENKEKELKSKQLETMLTNIDNYDGTGLGQKRIPKE